MRVLPEDLFVGASRKANFNGLATEFEIARSFNSSWADALLGVRPAAVREWWGHTGW